MEIAKVGVLGCGLMGHGITHICAQAGWDVVVREVDQEKLDKGTTMPTRFAAGSRRRSTTRTLPTATS